MSVNVTNQGDDRRQIEPMLDQLRERSEVVPAETLADGGHTARAVREAEAERNTAYAPVLTTPLPSRPADPPVPRRA